MNVIIIHGAFGYPTENWFDWLRHELEREGIACLVPQMPTPMNNTLENWLTVFQQVQDLMTSDSILIGHSLGATFLLRWLERNTVMVKSVILVGGFVEAVGHSVFDAMNKTFIDEKFDWSAIRTTGNNFESYYGCGDPYVSRFAFDQIANSLSARKIIVANAQHFNSQSGYQTFSLLKHRVINCIKQG